jgi:hypothetical protein
MPHLTTFSLALMTLFAAIDGGESVAADAVMLQSTTGICQAGPEWMQRFAGASSWDRQDVAWALLEPQRGQFQDSYLANVAERVKASRARGQWILPMIGFGVGWASDRTATYRIDDTRTLVLEGKPDGTVLQQDKRRSPDGAWRIAATETLHELDKIPIAADRVPDWVEAVRRITTRLMAADCGLRYFQIWNEAHPDSGFWHGDLTTYIQRIHLPAARAIHALGGKVVYGGWPCCGSLQSLIDLLDRTDAWGSIDVIDVHYFSVDAYRILHEAALKRGRQIGVWQTEIGFTTERTFIANVYPRFLAWSLRNGPGPDSYKMFFFSAWSPDDPKAYGYGRTLMSGNTVSAHGECLRTLGELLGAAPVGMRAGVTCVPALSDDLNEHQSALEAFTVGPHRIVVAVHLVHPSQNRPTQNVAPTAETGIQDITITIAGLARAAVARIDRVSARGSTSDVTAMAADTATGLAVRLVSHVDDPVDPTDANAPVVIYASILLK